MRIVHASNTTSSLRVTRYQYYSVHYHIIIIIIIYIYIIIIYVYNNVYIYIIMMLLLYATTTAPRQYWGIAMIQYMQQPCALLLHNTCKYECYNIMIEL
jgi:hypothetical protein